MGGTQEPPAPDGGGKRRSAAELVLLAVVCVLAGFVVGVVRSHGTRPAHPVTVRTTVAVRGSS